MLSKFIALVGTYFSVSIGVVSIQEKSGFVPYHTLKNSADLIGQFHIPFFFFFTIFLMIIWYMHYRIDARKELQISSLIHNLSEDMQENYRVLEAILKEARTNNTMVKKSQSNALLRKSMQQLANKLSNGLEDIYNRKVCIHLKYFSNITKGRGKLTTIIMNDSAPHERYRRFIEHNEHEVSKNTHFKVFEHRDETEFVISSLLQYRILYLTFSFLKIVFRSKKMANLAMRYEIKSTAPTFKKYVKSLIVVPIREYKGEDYQTIGYICCDSKTSYAFGIRGNRTMVCTEIIKAIASNLNNYLVAISESSNTIRK